MPSELEKPVREYKPESESSNRELQTKKKKEFLSSYNKDKTWSVNKDNKGIERK